MKLGKKVYNKKLVAGAAIVLIILSISIFGPVFYQVNPNTIDPVQRLSSIHSEGHILGTDHLGRDMLARILHGTKLSVLSSFATALVAIVLGVAIGLFAGMSKKWVDIVVMRIVDLLQSFPSILLCVLIVAILGPNLRNAMIAIAIVNIPFFAVLTRSVTLSEKEKEYVRASKAIGNSDLYTAVVHILPNISTYLISQSMMTVGWMLTSLTSLSFLGLGVQPPEAELGSMLGELRTVMILKPSIVAIPGIVIIIIVIGINLFGDGLKEQLDPKN